MNKYQNMYSLFEKEPDAKQYFDKLPGYIQEQIKTRSDNITSFDRLQGYADNLLRGDH